MGAIDLSRVPSRRANKELRKAMTRNVPFITPDLHGIMISGESAVHERAERETERNLWKRHRDGISI